MPRRRVRVRVVAAASAEALQPALDTALTEEQADRSWHVSDVSLAATSCNMAHADAGEPESYVALISLRKQEWFFLDLLKGVFDVVRGKATAPEDAAPS